MNFSYQNPLACSNCSCPMNSHELLYSSNQFTNQIAQMLLNKKIVQNNMNFDCFLAIFTVDKNFKQTKTSNIAKFSKILNDGSYQVLNYYEIDSIEKIVGQLIQRKLFINNVLLQDKVNYEIFSNLFGSDLYRDLLNQIGLEKMREVPENPKMHSDFLIHKVRCKIKAHKYSKSRLFIFCISSFMSNSLEFFKKYLSAASQLIPSQFNLFYVSKNKKNAIVDTQVFFPSLFKSYLCSFFSFPEMSMFSQKKVFTDQQNADKLKDLLDFNLFQVIKQYNQPVNSNYQKPRIQKCLSLIIKNSNEFANLILKDNKFRMTIAQKFGSPNFFNLNFLESPNFYQVQNEEENRQIFKFFFKENYENQRVVIILRPIVVKSQLSDILLNIFKINNFVIIQNSYQQLTENQVYFLSKVENISDANYNSYKDLMLDGPSQIVLMTNYGAINQANSICNGGENSLKKSSFKSYYKLDNLVYESQFKQISEIIQTKHFNFLESLYCMNPFYGIKDMVLIDQILFSSIKEQEKLYLNQKTNTISWGQMDNFDGQQTIKKRNQYQEQLQTQLQNNQFNFFSYPSSNNQQTEELVQLFIPECSSVELINVIIKPCENATDTGTIVLSVKQMLLDLGFKIPFEKQLIKSKLSALLKEIEGFDADFQDDDYIKSIEQQWEQKPFTILSLVKMSAIKETMELLKNWTSDIIPQNDTLLTTKFHLSKFLIPCWNTHLFYRTLWEIDKSLIDITRSNTWYNSNTFKYIVSTTYGDIDSPGNFIEIKSLHMLQDQDSLIYKLENELEVRIMKKEQIEIITELQEIQRWAYEQVNRQLPGVCPLSYHARIFPSFYSSTEEVFQIFDIQQFCGFSFLEEIWEQMAQYNSETDTFIENNSAFYKKFQQQNKQQGALVAFLWGFKLAKFIKKIEGVRVPSDIEGYGKIICTEETFKGKSNLKNEQYLQDEEAKYNQIVDRIFNDLTKILEADEYHEFENKNSIRSPEEILKYKLKQIFDSKIYLEFRQQKYFRLLPSELYTNHLRLVQDRSGQFEQELYNTFSTININYEKEGTMPGLAKTQKFVSQQVKNFSQFKDDPTKIDQFEDIDFENLTDEYFHKQEDIYKESVKQQKETNGNYTDYCLVNFSPYIKSKYHLLACIKFLLEYDLPLLNKTSISWKASEEKYLSLIDGIKQGFEKNYQMDSQDQDTIITIYTQLSHQEQQIMPDLVQMEVFFYILDQLEKYYNEIEFSKERRRQLKNEKNIESDARELEMKKVDFNKRSELSRQFTMYLEKMQKKIDNENKKIDLLKKCILDLLDISVNMDIVYNYQKELFQVTDQDLTNKQFLPREKYFTDFSPPVPQKIYPPEQLRLELNPKVREFQSQTIALQQAQNKLIYAANLEQDTVARHWISNKPNLIQFKQKEQIQEKKGIIVEKIESQGDKLVNEAMDREIQRIREAQRLKKEKQFSKTYY